MNNLPRGTQVDVTEMREFVAKGFDVQGSQIQALKTLVLTIMNQMEITQDILERQQLWITQLEESYRDLVHRVRSLDGYQG